MIIVAVFFNIFTPSLEYINTGTIKFDTLLIVFVGSFLIGIGVQFVRDEKQLSTSSTHRREP